MCETLCSAVGVEEEEVGNVDEYVDELVDTGTGSGTIDVEPI